MCRFLLLLLLAPLAGCDGGSTSESLCSGLALQNGTFTATTSGGAMTADCFSVSEAQGRTLFIAYDVSGGVQNLRLPLTITFDGTSTGTYTLDDNGDQNDTDESFAQIGQTSTLAAQFATSGTATIDAISSTTFRGTFSFTTSMGLTARGTFSVDR